MTTTRTKSDYTFGELEGVDYLAALGIQIEDDVSDQQPASYLAKLSSCARR